MDKALAIARLRELIFKRFNAGPERQRWLDWLAEIAEVEKHLEKLSDVPVDDVVNQAPARLN